jgi:hypothetical protein
MAALCTEHGAPRTLGAVARGNRRRPVPRVDRARKPVREALAESSLGYPSLPGGLQAESLRSRRV